jgi:hypothetical protein
LGSSSKCDASGISELNRIFESTMRSMQGFHSPPGS